MVFYRTKNIFFKTVAKMPKWVVEKNLPQTPGLLIEKRLASLPD